MKNSTLWRKQSSIVMLLSETLNIDIEKALDLFYSSNTYQELQDPKSGLLLMSDKYILEDILEELKLNS